MECSASCLYRKALSSKSYSKIRGYIEDKTKCNNHPTCLIQCILSSLTSTSLDNAVKVIITHYFNDLNKYRDKHGNSFLNLLASKVTQYQKVIKTILTSNKIDMNVTDAKGYNFLMNLLEYKKHTLMIQIITNIPDLDFNYNHKANDGHTLLTLFCKYIVDHLHPCYDNVIQLLLNKGCDPNISSPMKYIVKMKSSKVKDMLLDSGYMISEEDIIESNKFYLDNIVIPLIKGLRKKHKILGMRGVLTNGTIIGAKKCRTWMKSYLLQRDTADWQEWCSYIGDIYMSDLRSVCKSLGISINTSDDTYEDTYYNKEVKYKVNNKIHTIFYKKLVVRYKVGDGKVTIRHKISQLEQVLKKDVKYIDRLSLCYNSNTMLGTPVEDIVPSRYITEKYQNKYYAFEIEEIQKIKSISNGVLVNPYTRQPFSKSFISKANNMIDRCKGNLSNDSYLPLELSKVYREADHILYNNYNAKILVDKINNIVSSCTPDRFDFSYMLTADIYVCISILNFIQINLIHNTNFDFTCEVERETNVDIIRCMVLNEIYKLLIGPESISVSLILSATPVF